MTLLAWGVAWLLDFIIGDPQSWPHPVRWIGNLIAAVQRGRFIRGLAGWLRYG